MPLRKMSSPDDTSSLGKDYDDGVYEKEVEAKSSQSSRYTPSRAPTEQPPKLPTIMLACLIMLLVSCFVGILLSGLHFGNAVHSGDCLGQSWVMFSVRILQLHTVPRGDNSRTSASLSAFPPPPPSHNMHTHAHARTHTHTRIRTTHT